MKLEIIEQKAKIFDLINEKEFHQQAIERLMKSIGEELEKLNKLLASSKANNDQS